MTGTWNPISTSTLSDRVYSALRDGILRGVPGPGEFVREVDVSESLGVSRTPVREALAQLARDGYVERIARRGYRVPAESVDRLLELYPIVAALEVLAGELAFPRIDEATIALLREANRECIDSLQANDIRASIHLNDRFHHLLSEPCGNQHLCDLLDQLRAQVVRLELWSASHLEHAIEATHQHDDIITAIERGDFATALALLKTNRLQTYTAFLQVTGRTPADT
ncbi:MAG: GntR family transcriptional regulator [Gemmatimonadales bacterium]|nr:GntR family transcriptional regulator [Gemmatimonadales bacterium]